MSEAVKDASPQKPRPLRTAGVMWAYAYRMELLIFLVAVFVLASFSGQRFLRQSAAPHFVYQAQSWLEGRTDIDAEVLPNFEDWACVREVAGVKQRCQRPLLPTDRWYSSFPAFPAVLMLPFVAVNGFQFNDTSFGVLMAALALAFFYSLLRLYREHEGTARSPREDVAITLLLGFGTLFFYAAIRGEVWFSAEVIGVGLTALYLRNSVGARRPMLAGLFWSMAVLTRAPLFFTGIFFLLEAVCPTKGQRNEDINACFKTPGPVLKKLKGFVIGALPLGVAAAVYNQVRFGRFTEFGHRFFYENRVNQDIDTFGLFNVRYLARNVDAAFLTLPRFSASPLQLGYDAWGLSLFITLPLLALAFTPATKPKQAWALLSAMGGCLVLSSLMPGGPAPVGDRSAILFLALAGALGMFAFFAYRWATSPEAPRALVPVLVTLVACMLPGLFYQNTGYAQFGFRFSLDYTPYVMLLVAMGGWSFRRPISIGLAAASIIVNVWGAAAFRGYTELVRGWR